jgi:Lon protease-like protein
VRSVERAEEIEGAARIARTVVTLRVMTTRQIPIFPLSIVLFPGMTLPIRVFEPRYRQMLRDCLRNDRRFGVVLIRKGKEAGDPNVEPHSVGSVAEIKNIGSMRRGSLPVTVTGERRFRIVEIDRSLPYLTATVELLGDGENEDTADGLLTAARNACRRYMSMLLAGQGMWHTEIGPPSEGPLLAYFMGMLCQTAPPRSLQVLLEEDSLEARLTAGVALLEEHEKDLEPSIMRAGPGSDESLFSFN